MKFQRFETSYFWRKRVWLRSIHFHFIYDLRGSQWWAALLWNVAALQHLLLICKKSGIVAAATAKSSAGATALLLKNDHIRQKHFIYCTNCKLNISSNKPQLKWHYLTYEQWETISLRKSEKQSARWIYNPKNVKYKLSVAKTTSCVILYNESSSIYVSLE